jgi:hypothetical protein
MNCVAFAAATFALTHGGAQLGANSSVVSAMPCSSPHVPLLSYHVHVLFWPSNKQSVSAAMQLQSDFVDAFGALVAESVSSTPLSFVIVRLRHLVFRDQRDRRLCGGGEVTMRSLGFLRCGWRVRACRAAGQAELHDAGRRSVAQHHRDLRLRGGLGPGWAVPDRPVLFLRSAGVCGRCSW